MFYINRITMHLATILPASDDYLPFSKELQTFF